jgi:cysteine dioxygenase
LTSTNNDTKDDGPITLSEFIQALPPILHKQKDDAQKSIRERVRQDDKRGTKSDPVNELFSRLDLSTKEWLEPYRQSEPNKNYTRNLIATDNETFTLLLPCWNAEKESPIHDHPCDGCWLRVCEGKIQETRYKIDKDTDKMEVTSDEIFEDNYPAFIKDSMRFHKIGNPSKQPAVTLNLYCPPFNQCRIWLDPTHASKQSNVFMCNYSEFGVTHTCEKFEVGTI